MNKNTPFLLLAFFLSTVGVVIIIYFSVEDHFNDGSFKIDTTLASAYGNFIGGLVGPIFSFAGILLIYHTIVEQRKLFQIQQFEVKFFELLRIHRDNIANMKHVSPASKTAKSFDGIRVFIKMKTQLIKLQNHFKESNINLKDSKSLVFIFFYYGVSKNEIKEISSILNIFISDSKFVDVLLEFVRSFKTKYNVKLLYFGGHKSRLDPYIKNLEEMIYCIVSNNQLSSSQKQNYFNIIRAQITYHELYILKLYCDSLSIVYNEYLKEKLSDRKAVFVEFVNKMETSNIFNIELNEK